MDQAHDHDLSGPRPTGTGGALAGTTWDVVVIGAGPAGALAARELARRGPRVLLVDRRAFPRPKTCGGCLNAAALNVLESVGLGGLLANAGAVPIEKLRVQDGRGGMEVHLPRGMALSRARLDAALVDAAQAMGAHFLDATEAVFGPVEAGHRLLDLAHAGTRFTVRARLIVVACGLLPARRGPVSEVAVRVASRGRLGVSAEFPGPIPLAYRPGTIFMAVQSTGYVGIVQVENGRWNLAAALAPGELKQSGSPASAVARALARAGFPPIPELQSAHWQGTMELTRRARPLAGERWFLIGDAAGYVEPFTGEGIAWALASAVGVVPVVHDALASWSPAACRLWRARYRQAISHRQRLCRAVAFGLRHPSLFHPAFTLADRFPALAQAFVQHLHGPLTVPMRRPP